MDSTEKMTEDMASLKARMVAVLADNKRMQDELMYGRDSINMKSLRRFMEAANQLPGDWQTALLYRELIEEEVVNELFTAFDELKAIAHTDDIVAKDAIRIRILDGIADGMVTLKAFGEALNMDVVGGYNEVMRSNMTKINADGTVQKNQYGKVIKPDTYHAPRLGHLV
jgi:predicted HAD superfamily Cof-like phosphohydrolase